jgi:hypothetical protein
MAPVNGYVYNMHKVPTYSEIIEEAIIHPVDKIKLPDRQALCLRNLPQMTRFDEVDDPANIGEEQQRIQESKLKELTLRQLVPGTTQSIARVKEAQKRPQEEYIPGGGGALYGPAPPPTPPGRMRRAGGGIARIGASVGSAIGNGILDGMMSGVDYMTTPAGPPFQWQTTDYDAGLRADREIRAQQEQADWDYMHADLNRFNQASSQAHEAFNAPASTATYYIGDDEPSSPAAAAAKSSSPGAASSTGGWDRVALAKEKRLAAEKGDFHKDHLQWMPHTKQH